MNKKVVVTGLGAITPLGNNVAEFWNNIQASVCGIGMITKFDTSRLEVKIAAEVKGFDPVAHGLDRKEARRMALFTQYAVAAANQAWADAGLKDNPAVNPERVGVYIGNGIGGKEVDEEGNRVLFEKGPNRLSPFTVPMIIANEGAGNVSISLNAKGPVLTIVTACASGTDAIGAAMDLIRTGRADVVVAGGSESTITEYCVGGFQVMRALSTNLDPLKACRPFDKDRDGFIMGEGAGILILESEEFAKARGARIYAEVAGYGATGDAYHLTAPDPEASGAIRAIKAALDDANLKIDEVDYVNAHGTSTPLNDPMETKAVKAVFGDQARRLKMSSTKSMTGHLLGAAGAIEAIISILSIRDGVFPPTINYNTPDPDCDLDIVPNTVQKGEVRAAISTSLGFGGHNAVLAFRRY